MVRHVKKSHRRDAAISSAWEVVGQLATSLPAVADAMCLPCAEIDEWPAGLDPADGKLDERRDTRKKEQLASVAQHVLSLIETSGAQRVVEVGAGSGHLGLLIAHLRPHCHVVLVEIKEYSCEVARARISTLGLANASVAQGSLDEYAKRGESFDLIVGLHCCGLLTDAVLSLALSRRAAVCVVPCCYGQVVGDVDHERGAGTAPRMHPRSAAFRALPLADGAFEQLARGADLVSGGDCSGEQYAAAKRCMLCVDADRLLWAQHDALEGTVSDAEPARALEATALEALEAPKESRVESVHSSVATGASEPQALGTPAVVRVAIGELSPPTCTPKNNVLMLWWLPTATSSGAPT